MWYRIIVFLILNFAALKIGSLFTTPGVSSEWYQNLDKAPWTPAGWVFGVAWSIIMICFAVYMAYAWKAVKNRSVLIALYALQWVLNVSWNLVFFRNQEVLAGLIIILTLTGVIAVFLFRYFSELKLRVFWVLPYFLWLLVACSLNAYIYFNN